VLIRITVLIIQGRRSRGDLSLMLAESADDGNRCPQWSVGAFFIVSRIIPYARERLADGKAGEPLRAIIPPRFLRLLMLVIPLEADTREYFTAAPMFHAIWIIIYGMTTSLTRCSTRAWTNSASFRANRAIVISSSRSSDRGSILLRNHYDIANHYEQR